MRKSCGTFCPPYYPQNPMRSIWPKADHRLWNNRDAICLLRMLPYRTGRICPERARTVRWYGPRTPPPRKARRQGLRPERYSLACEGTRCRWFFSLSSWSSSFFLLQPQQVDKSRVFTAGSYDVSCRVVFHTLTSQILKRSFLMSFCRVHP